MMVLSLDHEVGLVPCSRCCNTCRIRRRNSKESSAKYSWRMPTPSDVHTVEDPISKQTIYNPELVNICPDTENSSCSMDPLFIRKYCIPGVRDYQPEQYDLPEKAIEDSVVLSFPEYMVAIESLKHSVRRDDVLLRGAWSYQDMIQSDIVRSRTTAKTSKTNSII